MPSDGRDDVLPLENSSAEAAGLLIEPVLATTVNYASWQNSIPFVHELKVRNLSGETQAGLRLELTTFPQVARKKVWVIERIAASDEITLTDRDIQLDPDYLACLNEAEKSEVRLTLLKGETVVSRRVLEVRVLARDEWGGMGLMPELLAAFVMPNDPAVAKILKSAAQLLAKQGYPEALDGYQSGDPKRAYLLVAAVWSAVSQLGLDYANPPRSFEVSGQKTRRPGKIVSDGLATCLDTSLLFASAIEALGLNAVIVMVKGHCVVGAWLIDKTSPLLVGTDCSEVRKALAAHELITFESTMVTGRNVASFRDAVGAAAKTTQEAEEGKFVGVVDVARARMAQIRPLASHEQEAAPEDQGSGANGVGLPKPGTINIAPSEVHVVDEKPSTPVSRIDRWQRKLLDLSLRNRLLNFKVSKQTVPIMCPDIPLLEDQLAANVKLKLTSLPEQNPIGERDLELHRNKTAKDLNTEFAADSLQRNELTCDLFPDDLTKRLTALYRKVRNDLSEGGSNTLFLAVGFLKWKQKPEDEKSYRAPLLLVPVKLIRKSALSAFRLEHHEDEVRFNATLIQLLKKDFDRDLSRFENDLPTDASGVDVPGILDSIRQEVRDIPGFEVVNETALSTFSFAKYLMWKDLVDRVDDLTKNRVVRHLIENPDKAFDSGGTAIPSPGVMDVNYKPVDMVHPLPADSSQLAAVMAASEGKDYVLVGPPGTGKSQTIANIIAQCLATQKTVLFVAEKTAALDVVYRRLREHGLGDSCLELHSNKAERRKFLEQMESSWKNNTRNMPGEWVTISERLRVRRDELNDYVSAIHRKYPNGWTPFEGFGEVVKGAGVGSPKLAWPTTVKHSRERYDSLCSTVADLGLTFGALGHGAKLPMVDQTEWSARWESGLLDAAGDLSSASETLGTMLANFTTEIGLDDLTDCSLEQLEALCNLARRLLACRGIDVRVLFHKKFNKFPNALGELRGSISRLETAERKATGAYTAMLGEVPVDELDQQWRQAVATIWPLSWLAKGKVRRVLSSYSQNNIATPETDLPAIRVMREQGEAIETSVLADQVIQWNHRNTDLEQLDEHLQLAGALRASIILVCKTRGSTTPVSEKLLPLLDGGAGSASLLSQAEAFLSAAERFCHATEVLGKHAGVEPVDSSTLAVCEVSHGVGSRIVADRSELRRWTAWCEVRRRAEAHGLELFTQGLEDGSISAVDISDRFRLSYARWWVPQIVDADDVLRGFQRFRHEAAVEEFCALDEQARLSAPSRVLQGLSHDLPNADEVTRRSELGLLRHQIGLKRPSKSIREVISGMPDAFGKLAPCLLMSPLSIAQYLPANQAIFDVVVFDEASQITTWDAIGAIARGRQTIIVGDPKQLPPTNFFGRADGDDENEDLEDYERDLESILDEAKASGLPTLQLNWHYRSQHESLIAFSNYHYYNNQLVTFPAAESEERGVSLTHNPNAVYDRGKSRTNRTEAEEIVRCAVTRMRTWLKEPVEKRPTFGVITFNSQQQSLIQDLFDEAQRQHPELDWYFSDDRVEPSVVKNLENVQGDERDVMFFSVTFGRSVAGKEIPLNFGALNRDGGERRLNVAITRARRELLVYSSFKADDLNAERSKARGVSDLKRFLEYAEKGASSLVAEVQGSMGGFDSPFEEAVADALQKRGWEVVTQVGVSGFRVDLGIVHPDKPGAYLAGVECDGATYHRSAIARDRDKTRQQVLENLGWSILRIWSPDWWYDAENATGEVDSALNELLAASREKNGGTQGKVAGDHSDDVGSEDDGSGPDDPVFKTVEPVLDEDVLDLEDEHGFVRAELEGFDVRPEDFFEAQYSSVLREMIYAILKAEAPIREDVLAKQISRVHGFARTGSKIRERVMNLLPQGPFSSESTGTFLWGELEVKESIRFRPSFGSRNERNVDEISVSEICGLVVENLDVLSNEDSAIAVARLMGINRLKKASRARLQEAIDMAVRMQQGDVQHIASLADEKKPD